LQTQIYVCRRERELSEAVLGALQRIGESYHTVTWVAPLECNNFYEPRDGAFLRALELSDMRQRLSEFWPARGPRWDALALLEPGSAILLGEGKSYPAEMLGRGCMATPASRAPILTSLGAARSWLHARPDADWLGPLYQYANRLAHVYFLRKICGRPAFLANLCFLDDERSPTSRADWESQLSVYKEQLGFPNGIPHSVDVFLPARSRSELLSVA
jgi:hypothetical protein